MDGPEFFLILASILAGLVGLIVGASLLVRGASSLARDMGVPKLVIGLTIVAFGTSAPEFAASLNAGLAGHAGLAVGNVVGSNILNVLLILGTAAAISPLFVASRLARVDIPLMIAASTGVWLMSIDGVIGAMDSAVLILAFAGYILLQFSVGKNQITAKGGVGIDEADGTARFRGGRATAAAACALGLLFLVLGSEWLVSGSVKIASAYGLSEQVIGLTIVALGTSLPELATSIAAALKKEMDLAVGNVVGSNIFNLLAVLGVSGMASSKGLTVPKEIIALDLPCITAVAVMLLPMSISGARISRAEGGLLLVFCVAYFGAQGLQMTGRPLPVALERMGLIGVLPSAGVVLLYSQLKSVRNMRLMLESFEEYMGEALAASVRTTRKIVIIMAGGSVLLVGIVMIVLPGPAVLVIPLGLAILGMEFAWAKRMLIKLQTEIRKRVPESLRWKIK